jgi:hypothetical protein
MKKIFLISILICFMAGVFAGLGGSPPINKQEVEKSFISDADVYTIAEIVLMDQFIMVNIQGVGISPGDNNSNLSITKNIRVEQIIGSSNSDQNYNQNKSEVNSILNSVYKANIPESELTLNNNQNVSLYRIGEVFVNDMEVEISPGDIITLA